MGGTPVPAETDQIIQAKLSPPAIAGNLIARPRLLAAFSGYEHRKATYLLAPAGYGKTVLMDQFRATLTVPSVWYHLDSCDNDSTVFLQYLLHGLAGILPGFGREAAALLRRGRSANQNPRRIVSALIEQLSNRAGPDVVIFLDDYHQLFSQSVHGVLDDLVAYLPERSHLVIAGRTDGRRPSPKMGSEGKIVVLGADDLRFIGGEIKSAAAAIAPGATDQDIEFWEKETAGWPLALCLLRAAAGTNERGGRQIASLHDYLSAEVLEKQPKRIRDFLVRTSVLETMTPELCNRLLDRTDAEQILKRLVKQELFITGIDGPAKAYRYHQLFRDFLTESLGRKQAGLQRKAARVALQLGETDQAVEYLLRARAFREAAPIIVEAGRNALRQGRWRTVDRWLGALPREEMAANPWLALHRAEVAACQGKLAEGELWINRALQIFTERRDQAGMAESLAKKGRILRSRGKYQESLKLMEEAIPCLLQEDMAERGELPLEQAMTLLFSGRLMEAESILRPALAKAESRYDAFIIAHLAMALGNLYFVRGELWKAMEMIRRSTSVAAEPIMTSYFLCDDAALIYMEWGEIDQALAHARRGIAVLEGAGLLEILPSAHLQLAFVQMETGEMAAAADGFRRAISCARHGRWLMGGSPYTAGSVKCSRRQGCPPRGGIRRKPEANFRPEDHEPGDRPNTPGRVSET